MNDVNVLLKGLIITTITARNQDLFLAYGNLLFPNDKIFHY